MPLTALRAQTYTVVASFGGFNGQEPQVPLVQSVNGDFYGTTMLGGSIQSNGTVFKVTPAGTLVDVYNFCSLPNCTDGWQPMAPLVLGTNGNLYGTTQVGGTNLNTCLGPGCGTVFEITPAGKLTTLHSFCSLPKCEDGAVPIAGLVLGTSGNFYGAASKGGKFDGGTIFEITPAGKFTVLYSFCSQKNCPDGSYPVTSLIQATNGNFYGTTYDGGAIPCSYFNYTFGCGTIFEMTPSGDLTTLYSFGTDAGLMQQPLVQAIDGNIYGTSVNGGTGLCTYGCGTIFEIAPAGALNTVYSFCTREFCPDGAYPMAGLVQATNGRLYGTTSTGGGMASGTLFAATPAGSVNTVYDFGGVSTGEEPEGSLLQATDGSLYGVTNNGGSENQGTIFRFSTGLGPFVKTVPAGAQVGAKVIILGNKLTGTTSVSFNGTPATFTLIGSTAISTTVPAGATTGTVEVTTPAGARKSNLNFQVVP